MGPNGEEGHDAAGTQANRDGLGICGGCERFYNGDCWLTRRKDSAGNHVIDERYVLGQDIIFLRCLANDYHGNPLYRPLKPTE